MDGPMANANTMSSDRSGRNPVINSVSMRVSRFLYSFYHWQIEIEEDKF